MVSAVKSLSSIIPNIRNLLFTVLDVEYIIQDQYGNINLKKYQKD